MASIDLQTDLEVSGDDDCLLACPTWQQANTDDVCNHICDQTGDAKFMNGDACVSACPEGMTNNEHNVCEIVPTAAPTAAPPTAAPEVGAQSCLLLAACQKICHIHV